MATKLKKLVKKSNKYYSTKAIVVNDNLEMKAVQSHLEFKDKVSMNDLIDCFREDIENEFSNNNQGVQSLILELESEHDSISRIKFNKIWDILAE